MKQHRESFRCPDCGYITISHDFAGHHCTSCPWSGLLCDHCGKDLKEGIGGFKSYREPCCMVCYPGSELEEKHQAAAEMRRRSKLGLSTPLQEQLATLKKHLKGGKK